MAASERLLSIGEFARASALSVSAVRFYGDRGILRPASIDEVTGYRSYHPSQVAQARLIRDLRSLQMPLADVVAAIEAGPEERQARVDAQIARLEVQLADARTVAQTLGETRLLASASAQPRATTIHAREFRSAIEQVVPMSSRDLFKPHLMVVRIEVRAGSVRLVSTDSFRMTVRDLVPQQGGEEFAAVVAAAALMEWEPSASHVDLLLDGGNVVLRSGEAQWQSEDLPIDFPPYDRVLNRSTAPAVAAVVDRTEMAAVLDAFEGDAPVRLAVGEQTVELSRADRQESCHAQVDGAVDGLKPIALNPQFAAEAVRWAVGSEVALELTSASEPVAFRSADAGTYTSLLMPIITDS